VTVITRLVSVRRAGNGLVAVLGSDSGMETEERQVDHVVIKHGTLPVDELYEALKPASRNGVEVDHATLLGDKAQAVVRNAGGTYRLFRIGDAIASRNSCCGVRCVAACKGHLILAESVGLIRASSDRTGSPVG